MAGIVAAILLLAGGGYALYTMGAEEKKPAPTPSATPMPSPSQTVVVPTNTSSPPNELLAGGSSYVDPQGIFTILYPSDYKLDTSDPQHPRIYKTGATQQGQTEMYDGALVVFETDMLNGKTLSQWVDERIKSSTADGTSKVISPKKAYQLKTYNGFTFALQGLGDATYYALQKDQQSNYVVLITTGVSDPKNVGFQKEIDNALSTTQLLK